MQTRSCICNSPAASRAPCALAMAKACTAWHALVIAHATSQDTLCACMHLLMNHSAVLVAPEHAQLTDPLGCIWFIIVSKIRDSQLCSQGIPSAVEVFGIQAC